MNKAVIFFVLFLSSTFGNAQGSTPEIGAVKHYFYFNPGALINVPSGFQVGYERIINRRTHWDIQGGPLLYSRTPSFSDLAATKKRGVRIQGGLKNYMSSRFYLGPQVLFKRVTMNERIWFDRYGGSFQQRIDVRRVRRTVALAMDIGWEYKFEKKPMLLEISYGVGIQNLKVGYENYPDDIDTGDLRGVGVAEGISILPFFNYNIRLKFPLVSKSKSMADSPTRSKNKKSSRKKKSRKNRR